MSSSPPSDTSDTPNDEDIITTKLKSALWLPLGQLVDDTTLNMDKNATPQFIGALTELVWHQVVNVSADVEGFARHAGRTTVTAGDVLLVARRNEALAGLLKEHLESVRAESKSKKQKR